MGKIVLLKGVRIGDQLRHSKVAVATLAFIFQIGVVAAGRAEMSLTADVEPQTSLNETVSLRLTLVAQSSVSVGEVSFEAPDFSEEGESSQVAVEIHSGSSGSSIQHTHELIRILRPKRPGKLKISKIKVEVDGKSLQANDLFVDVSQSQKSSSQGSQGLSSAARSQKQTGTGVLVRAEVDKAQLYKGEQVIVSYYLYHQTKVFNLQVDKFPSLSGFLREDLDLPIRGQRLPSQEVLFNGASYHRSLLAKYAAYPLQEGKLLIDPISLKYNYYSGQRDFYDDEDPFFSFFQHVSPKVGAQASDPVEISVLSPPDDGRPLSFTGGVGKFSIDASLSAPEVEVNKAVSYFIKVEGKGNLASIQAPKLKLPEGLELYETKNQMQKAQSGLGQKVFEYLIIPRTNGDILIPEVNLGFFDPSQKKYNQISTLELTLRVTGQPSLAPVQSSQNNSSSDPNSSRSKSPSVSSSEVQSIRPMKGQLASSFSLVWEILLVMNFGVFSALGFFIIRNLFRKRRLYRRSAWIEFEKKYSLIHHSNTPEKIREGYAELVTLILESMREGGVEDVLSLSRYEQSLYFPEDQRARFLSLMEKVDRLRFGGEEAHDLSEDGFQEDLKLGGLIRNQFEKKRRR